MDVPRVRLSSLTAFRLFRTRSGARSGMRSFFPAAVGPVVATTGVAASLFYALSVSELMSLDGGKAPEYLARLVGIGIVIIANVVVVAPLVAAPCSRAVRTWMIRHSRRIIDVFAVAGIAAVGAACAVLDMSFCVSDFTEFQFIALAAGLIAMGPMFLRRGQTIRGMLSTTALFCILAGWLAAQPQISWNMRRSFLKAYSRIQIGMMREEVEAIIIREFPGKRPIARVANWGIQYTLDPEDGRYNAEFLLLEIANGSVISKQYLDD
jgi:hypothetical protein